jgi:hypothetical protein
MSDCGSVATVQAASRHSTSLREVLPPKAKRHSAWSQVAAVDVPSSTAAAQSEPAEHETVSASVSSAWNRHAPSQLSELSSAVARAEQVEPALQSAPPGSATSSRQCPQSPALQTPPVGV